jgi:hypothetical protein
MAIEKRLLLQGFLVSEPLASRAAFIQQMNHSKRTSGEQYLIISSANGTAGNNSFVDRGRSGFR